MLSPTVLQLCPEWDPSIAVYCTVGEEGLGQNLQDIQVFLEVPFKGATVGYPDCWTSSQTPCDTPEFWVFRACIWGATGVFAVFAFFFDFSTSLKFYKEYVSWGQSNSTMVRVLALQTLKPVGSPASHVVHLELHQE